VLDAGGRAESPGRQAGGSKNGVAVADQNQSSRRQ